MTDKKIAALFVHKGGCYFDLPHIDPWDEERDARTYAGPYPIIAHPPCQRWGRYYNGGPMYFRYHGHWLKRGDDLGCFAAAIMACRKYGGVVEHPEGSWAWRTFGMVNPPRSGGWVVADFEGGWTCCVEQGQYGHKARKPTWLYAHGIKDLPSLKWGKSKRQYARIDDGFHSSEERRQATALGFKTFAEWKHRKDVKMGKVSRLERIETPLPFRDLLIGMVSSIAAPQFT
jgi:hypothetical protein